ncbi:MAG: hypothetical protein OSB55_03260 [Verrucomicrobiota bacterium]|nr:hypothetical protein [Verrucomicrobiota bacterium]
MATANAVSLAFRVALSDSASAWVFSPIRLAKLANSPLHGLECLRLVGQFVLKEFAAGAFAA